MASCSGSAMERIRPSIRRASEARRSMAPGTARCSKACRWGLPPEPGQRSRQRVRWSRWQRVELTVKIGFSPFVSLAALRVREWWRHYNKLVRTRGHGVNIILDAFKHYIIEKVTPKSSRPKHPVQGLANGRYAVPLSMHQPEGLISQNRSGLEADKLLGIPPSTVLKLHAVRKRGMFFHPIECFDG